MPLVRVERVLGTSTPERMRDEVAARLVAGVLSAGDSQRAVDSLIADLRDDGIAGNGLRAMDRLGALGTAAIPALERAIGSTEWQTRQLAAQVLRDIASYEPTEGMLRVTVEGLADDDLPYQRPSGILGHRAAYTGLANARAGVEYLIQYPGRVGRVLREGMAGQDVQQRMLCAVVAATTGREELIPMAGPILIEHLRANHIGGDAKRAAAALWAFGPGIVPLLTPVLDSADVQQRDLARLVLIELGALHPPDGRERERLNAGTRTVEDPSRGDVAWTEGLE